jgi:hypothetical protein
VAAQLTPGSLQMSQFSSAYDWNAAFVWKVMSTVGGDSQVQVDGKDKRAWSSAMLDMTGMGNSSWGSSSGPRASTFIGAGDNHCVIPYRRMFWTQQGSVTLVDWLARMLAGNGTSNVECSRSDPPCAVGADLRNSYSSSAP